MGGLRVNREGERCVQRGLLKVEDEDGNVVFLRAGGVVAGKTGDVVEEGVSETGGRDIELRFQEFFAACLAEFFLRGVRMFHTRYQQIAMAENSTGELVCERRLENGNGEAVAFYRSLQQ